MKPPQPNTKLTRSSQLPPPHQTHQQTPLIITISDDSSTESETDHSSTESESDQVNSPLESEPDDYHSTHSTHSPRPVENQLGLEEWEFQHLLGIPEVPEPAGESQLFEGTRPTLTPNLDKIDCGVQTSQNELVEKNDIPVDAEMFLSLDGQVSIFV
jgi:hypothetical protein